MSDNNVSITCPVCGMRSFHPMDVQEGYCGRCHAYTGLGSSSREFCGQCLGCGQPTRNGKHTLSDTYACPRYPEGVG